MVGTRLLGEKRLAEPANVIIDLSSTQHTSNTETSLLFESVSSLSSIYLLPLKIDSEAATWLQMAW